MTRVLPCDAAARALLVFDLASRHNPGTVKTTRYFEEQVLRIRPYIQREWCERIIRAPIKRDEQSGGRVRFWVIVPEMGGRVLPVVTLEDGETVHNAFPDRNFKLK
jgi:hypothetical protein